MHAIWCKFLMRENIDEIEKFLLAIANAASATVLLKFYSSEFFSLPVHQYFPLSKIYSIAA